MNDAVYGEVTYHAAYEPQRAIRTDRWAYIERFADRRLPVLPNVDEGETRNLLLANGWAERAIDPIQLYDTLLDPMQLRNLVDDPTLADVRADLRTRLHAWMETTHDPILRGPVPMPEGGVANPVDGLSPNEAPLPSQA